MTAGTIRRGVQAVCALLSLLVVTPAVLAQGYPGKPLRYIVPYPAGGSQDTLSRVVAQQLAKSLGQPVVVDNKAGANGNIGTEEALRAPADGYTLLSTSHTVMAINPALYRNLSFDPARDLTAVAFIAPVNVVLAVHPSVPAKNLSQLIAYLKANPGKANFCSSGSGSMAHLAGELFKRRAGVDITHVPYKGDAPAFADLVGGHVQMMFANLVTAIPHIAAGRLVPIALAALTRDPTLPGLPTMSEAGLPGFNTPLWFGVVMKAGTPPEIVNRLHGEINKALALPEVKTRLAALGASPTPMTIEQFAALIREQREELGKVVRDSGARVD